MIIRSADEIRERLQLAVIEEINRNPKALTEPDNFIPTFIRQLTDKVTEIVLDEIEFRRRF